MAQEIYIYLDDSGVLHRHARPRFFVYAGYLFLSKKEKERALEVYQRAVEHLGSTAEIKAHGTSMQNRHFLLTRLAQCESFSCVVNKKRVYSTILNDRKSIHRYKDYCIRRAAKMKICDLIERGLIDPDKPTIIRLYIDNQPRSSDEVYNLSESIREELGAGFANYDYGAWYPSLFSKKLVVETMYCDSREHPLIQASDILANNVFTRWNYAERLRHWQLSHLEVLLP